MGRLVGAGAADVSGGRSGARGGPDGLAKAGVDSLVDTVDDKLDDGRRDSFCDEGGEVVWGELAGGGVGIGEGD